jgi:hypothetical protein
VRINCCHGDTMVLQPQYVTRILWIPVSLSTLSLCGVEGVAHALPSCPSVMTKPSAASDVGSKLVPFDIFTIYELHNHIEKDKHSPPHDEKDSAGVPPGYSLNI